MTEFQQEDYPLMTNYHELSNALIGISILTNQNSIQKLWETTGYLLGYMLTNSDGKDVYELVSHLK